MASFLRLLLIVAIGSMCACSGGSSATPIEADPITGPCDVSATWTISVHKIDTLIGSCSMNDCSSCQIKALMDVTESQGNISFEPLLAGLTMGSIFDGTIDLAGDFSTVHQTYNNATLIGSFDQQNCKMDAIITWWPNGTCMAKIEFTGLRY